MSRMDMRITKDLGKSSCLHLHCRCSFMVTFASSSLSLLVAFASRLRFLSFPSPSMLFTQLWAPFAFSHCRCRISLSPRALPLHRLRHLPSHLTSYTSSSHLVHLIVALPPSQAPFGCHLLIRFLPYPQSPLHTTPSHSQDLHNLDNLLAVCTLAGLYHNIYMLRQPLALQHYRSLLHSSTTLSNNLHCNAPSHLFRFDRNA